jgi:1,4-dihydroxy-2-naphthoate octaprenyltransferase
MNVKSWIVAARLRTLPLALSSIITGTACALFFGFFDWLIFVFAVLTTIVLQVLSNYANDYGDAVSGKDNQNRIGPPRAVASGEISKEAMKKAVQLFAGLALMFGSILLYFSFSEELLLAGLFLVIGLAAIAAAIKYTIGKNPYGYHGLGDLFVFIFFGIVGVFGTFFLYAKSLEWTVVFPAFSIGLLSVAVLNFNNMRDIENDALTSKNTLAVKLGLQLAKQYQYFIIFLGFSTLIGFAFWNGFRLQQYVFLLMAPFFAQLVKAMIKINKPSEFDPFLKKTALGTFVLSILFLISVVIQ